MISKNMTLADVVKAYPQAIEQFNILHIDYCCGGKDNLEKALNEKGLDSEKWIAELNEKMLTVQEDSRAVGLDELRQMPVNELIDHIWETHHIKERTLLHEIDGLVNKILVVHYEHHSPQLIELHGLFANLKKELEEHFAKEEKLIFPHMLAVQQGDQKNLSYVKALEDEHVAAGEIIKRIQTSTNDFTPPEGVCTSYQLAFRKLNELVEDIFMHIFKENSILFPKFEQMI
jgi:regulator of cell morphogenesis and NO signaling